MEYLEGNRLIWDEGLAFSQQQLHSTTISLQK
jgi:hypothetical protein